MTIALNTALFVLALILWRFRLGVLLLAIMGWHAIAAVLIVALLLAFSAWRARRSGQPF